MQDSFLLFPPQRAFQRLSWGHSNRLWSFTVVPNLNWQTYLPNPVHQRPVLVFYQHSGGSQDSPQDTVTGTITGLDSNIGAHRSRHTTLLRISGYSLMFIKLWADAGTLLYTMLTDGLRAEAVTTSHAHLGYELTQEHCLRPRSRTGYMLMQWLLATLTRVTSWCSWLLYAKLSCSRS